jgi:hypothetical protein
MYNKHGCSNRYACLFTVNLKHFCLNRPKKVHCVIMCVLCRIQNHNYATKRMHKCEHVQNLSIFLNRKTIQLRGNVIVQSVSGSGLLPLELVVCRAVGNMLPLICILFLILFSHAFFKAWLVPFSTANRD